MRYYKPLVVFWAIAVLLLALPLAAFSTPIAVPGAGDNAGPVVYLNNEPITFSTSPVIKKETLLVPAKDLATALGLGLTFSATDGVLHLFGNPGELEMTMGDNIAYLNGVSKELVCPAETIGETAYIPLLFTACNMGAEIKWNPDNQTALVYLPKVESQGALTVNVVDNATGLPIPKAMAAILETEEISYTSATGNSKTFLLDIPGNFTKNNLCVKPPKEVFELYSLYITADGYNPSIYRYIPVDKNKSIQVTIKLKKKKNNTSKQDLTDPIYSYYEDVYTKNLAFSQALLIGIENLPQDGLGEWVDSTKKNAGVFRKDTLTHSNYLVCQGEKATGGYKVKINNIACFPDKWIIDASYLSPAQDDIVTQAITYPMQTISVPLNSKPVIFRLNSNGSFRYLPVITH